MYFEETNCSPGKDNIIFSFPFPFPFPFPCLYANSVISTISVVVRLRYLNSTLGMADSLLHPDVGLTNHFQTLLALSSLPSFPLSFLGLTFCFLFPMCVLPTFCSTQLIIDGVPVIYLNVRLSSSFVIILFGIGVSLSVSSSSSSGSEFERPTINIR
jgi:hypothetical protein